MVRKINLKEYFIEWNTTKKLYVKWVSNSKLRYFSSKNLLIRGLSIWWATSLISKDNLNKKNWYIDLNKILNKRNIKTNLSDNFFIFYIIFFLKFFKNFFLYLVWNIFIKLVSFTRYKIIKEKKCFHSINYNFFFDKKQQLFLDRCYKYAFINKIKENFYLINVINKREYIRNIFKFKNKKINYVIADEQLSIWDIIEVYLKTLFFLLKLQNFLQKNKKIFYINNIDCKKVLKPFLISSFAGEIQNYILMGISVGKFLKRKNINYFINYGEFTPGFRPIYHFIRNSNENTKIFTIQHGNANTNLIYNLSDKSEFTSNFSKSGKTFSPCPDIYFTHGNQFNRILNSYFKSSKIIGPLKYDYHLISGNEKNFLKKNNKRKKNILICPSIGDHEIILDLLKFAVNHKHNFILSPHPTYSKYAKKYLKTLKKDCNIFYFKNKTTHDLLKKSDLVICGFSTIAQEAAILGVPSLRLLDIEKPYFHDIQDKIKIIFDPKILKSILNRENFNIFLGDSKLIEKKFYNKLDNKAFIRLEKFLK